MYFPSITKRFLAPPPMYLTTWSGAPMHLAAEALRCPFETFWWGGSDGGVSFEEPDGESYSRLPISSVLVRCEGPYRGWWGVVIEFCAVGDALCAIPF
jgi:hypothetical protein